MSIIILWEGYLPCESRHVDQSMWLVFCGSVIDSVWGRNSITCSQNIKERNNTRKDQAAFRISVFYFNGFPIHSVDTVNTHEILSRMSKKKTPHISPGFVALGPGIFSVKGVVTTRLILKAKLLVTFMYIYIKTGRTEA